VEVCNSFPKWGRRDQKQKFVFADNKILLMMTNAAKLLAGETGKKILFLVDNQASLKVLAGTNVKFDSVKMTRDALHSLGSTNNLELRWIEAHRILRPGSP
jgi:hypothetical protein